MVLDISTLISLIVLIIVGAVIVICCIYCCACKPAFASTNQRLLNRQIMRDEEALKQEGEQNRAQLRETLSTNEQARDDIRKKYQLK